MRQVLIQETKIVEHGESMSTDLTDNASLYPSPPGIRADFQPAYNTAITEHEVAILRPENPRTNDDWDMDTDTEETLHNQMPSKEWEYCIIAVNQVGEGEPGNTIMAVL